MGAIIHGGTFERPTRCVNTGFFDYNTDGAANIGLMPDFFEDLRQQGLKRSELEPVYLSADYLTIMWQNAIGRNVGIH